MRGGGRRTCGELSRLERVGSDEAEGEEEADDVARVVDPRRLLAERERDERRADELENDAADDGA